jgi:hypothetical protein
MAGASGWQFFSAGLAFRHKALKQLVPDEGIEPPTFGLQNRMSVA